MLLPSAVDGRTDALGKTDTAVSELTVCTPPAYFLQGYPVKCSLLVPRYTGPFMFTVALAADEKHAVFAEEPARQ